MRILLVDSDIASSEALQTFLASEGFSAILAQDGQQAIDLARHQRFDLIVLELILPRVGGLQVLRQLRLESPVPIIMLSTRAEDVDRIVALELGADDYVAKPVNPRELVARIRAITRRSLPKDDLLNVNGVTLRPVSRSVTADGQPIALTSHEFDILERLMRKAGQVVPRTELTNGDRPGQLDRSIDMHISRLRRKITPTGQAPRIKTIHRIGYQFLKESEHSAMVGCLEDAQASM